MRATALAVLAAAIAGCASAPVPVDFASAPEYAAANAKYRAGPIGAALVPIKRWDKPSLKALEVQVGRDQLGLFADMKDYCVQTGGEVAREGDSLTKFVEYLVPDASGGAREALFPGLSDVNLGGGNAICTQEGDIRFQVAYFTYPYFSANDGYYSLTEYFVVEKKPGADLTEFTEQALIEQRDFALRTADRFK